MTTSSNKDLPSSITRTVLIIEDERKQSEGLLVELRNRGISADVAVEPDEAINLIASYCYRVIILDLMLPTGLKNGFGDDRASYDVGIDVLKRIRNDERGGSGTDRSVPVIIVTAVTETSVIAMVNALKPAAIYSKPQRPSVLAEHTKTLLSNIGSA